MASATWTGTATSGLWTTTGNWSGGVIANGSGFTATFSSNITNTTTIDTTLGGIWTGTIGNLTFSDNGASGSSWVLGSQSTITLAVSSGSSTITTTTSATINGILAGSAPIIKAGAQTLTLLGANTFSGGLTHSVGTLSIGNAAALGTGKLTWSGGTLTNTTGDFTITNAMDLSGTLTWSFNSGNLTQQTGAVTLLGTTTFSGNVNTLIINGNIGDGGNAYGIVRNGGTLSLTLGGANTFTGPVTVTTGVLTANSVTALGSVRAAALTVANGATLSIGAALNYPSFSTSIAGTGVTSSGAISITSASAVNLGAITLTAAASIRPTVNGASLASSIITETSGTGYLLTVSMPTTSTTFTMSGLISGSGGLTLAASSNDRTLSLTNTANTFTGQVSAGGGKINAALLANEGVASSIGAATAASGNATIKLGQGASTGELVYTGAGTASTNRVVDLAGTTGIAILGVTTNGARLTYNAPAFTATGVGAKLFRLFATGGSFLTVESVIPDSSGGATRIDGFGGQGTVTLSGLNTFTGTTTWTNGILSVDRIKNVGGGASPLGAPTTVADGTITLGDTTSTGTLRYTGSGDTTDRVIRLGGTSTGGATIENNGTGALVFTSNITGVSATGTRTLTLSGINENVNDFQGVIANVGGGAGVTGLTKSNPGYWKLSGINTFTGPLTLTGGTLEVSSLANLGNTTNINISNSFRNTQLALPGGITLPTTMNFSAFASSGQNAVGDNLGGIRIVSAGTTTISGQVVTATPGVYADAGDLTFAGASTTTTASYTQPAVSGSVVVSVADTTIFTVGQYVTIATLTSGNGAITGGTYTVASISAGVSVTLTLVTAGSAAAGTGTVASGSVVATRLFTTTGANLAVARVAAGRTINFNGIGNTGGTTILYAQGPSTGRIVLRGTNASTGTPQIVGATLSVVLDGTTTFANTFFGAGAIGTSGGILNPRYSYTGGVLEFDNVGANTTISKLFTNGITSVRGPFTIRLKRSALQTFTVNLGSGVPATGITTIEYAGTPGTIGTNSLLNVSGAGANTRVLHAIISDGTALVPAAWTSSITYVTFPVYGTTPNFTSQGASSSGLTVATGTSQNVNVTGAVTGQTTATMSSVRLDTGGSMTLASGQTLGTGLLMDMGTGAHAPLTGGVLGAAFGGTQTLQIYNAAGTATITSGITRGTAPTFVKAGPGALVLSGVVKNVAGMNWSEGDLTFNGSLNMPYNSLVIANPFSGSMTMVLNNTPTVASFSGGGANTAISLTGGDLTFSLNPSATYAGSITSAGSQKLIFRSPPNTGGTHTFHGAISVPEFVFNRGFANIDPQYGATVAGAPLITINGTGGISWGNTNSATIANYTQTFGAVMVTGGHASLSVFSSGLLYYTRITVASVTRTNNAATVVLGNNSTPSSLSALTITSGAPAYKSFFGPWAAQSGSGFAVYRQAGTTMSVGGTTTALFDMVDLPIYGGATGDTNTLAPFTTGTPITGTTSVSNIIVSSAAITAQTSASMSTLQLTANLTLVSGATLSVDGLSTSTITLAGADATSKLTTNTTGYLYLLGNSNTTISATVADNGGTATTLVQSISGTVTLSGTNTYTGGTVLNNGFLSVSSDANLGNSSGGLTFNGGQLATTAGFTSNRTITLGVGGATLIPSASTNLVLSNTISGTGDLTYLGGAGSTVTLSGTNSMSGALRLGTGTLIVGSAGALGNITEFEAAGGTIRFDVVPTLDISSVIGPVSGRTYLFNNSSGSPITFASSFGNAGALTKSGADDLILSAANWITSGVSVTAGALVVTNAGALGPGETTTSGSVLSGATLVLRGTFTLPSPISTGRQFSFSGTGTATYPGALWADSGVVTVPGTIATNAAATIGCTSTGGLILSGNISLGASRTLTTRVDGTGNVKLTGPISGTGTSGITKTGDYTLELAPTTSNTYAGTTAVQVGTLKLTSETPDTVRPIPSGSAVVLSAGATIQTSTGILQKGRVTLASLDNSAGGTIQIGFDEVAPQGQSAASLDGTQYVENGGDLSFAGPMTVRLDPSVFHNGDYVLFDYSSGSFPGGGSELANITTDYSLLNGVTDTNLTNDTANNRIVLSVEGGFDQNVQECEADLVFPSSGTSNITLDEKLFNGVGEYTLFRVAGTVYNLANAVVTPAKADLSASQLYTKNGATTGNVYCTLSALN